MNFVKISNVLKEYDSMPKNHKFDIGCFSEFIRDNDVVACSEDAQSFFGYLMGIRLTQKKNEFVHDLPVKLDHSSVFKRKDGSIFLVSQNYGDIDEISKKVSALNDRMCVEVYDGTHCWWHPNCVMIVYSPKQSTKVIVNCKR